MVRALGGELIGDPGLSINRLAPLASAQAGELAFVAQARYANQMASTQASALIVPPALRDVAQTRGACIVTPDPYLYFARLTQWWRAQHAPVEPPRVDPLASIHPLAQVDALADVGPFVVIGANARVARGARIGAHAVIGAGASVGEDSMLHAHVTLGESCHVGARCILHSGVVIGADGFGFAPYEGRWVKIEQLGAVRIGNEVEIGANTCIDRGALDDTVIEDGVKLDNLVQIGHNVRVGRHSAMAGCVGVAGSATIGAHCTVGGGGIVLGHLTLADHVHVSASTTVTRSLNRPGQYTGMFPIDDNARWEKNAATLKQLHSLRERIKALEQSIKANQANAA